MKRTNHGMTDDRLDALIRRALKEAERREKQGILEGEACQPAPAEKARAYRLFEAKRRAEEERALRAKKQALPQEKGAAGCGSVRCRCRRSGAFVGRGAGPGRRNRSYMGWCRHSGGDHCARRVRPVCARDGRPARAGRTGGNARAGAHA